MTIAFAQRVLSGPLRFGDTAQVAALAFLHAVNEARERVAHCRHCEGLGVDSRGWYCGYCAANYDGDVVAALGVYASESPP